MKASFSSCNSAVAWGRKLLLIRGWTGKLYAKEEYPSGMIPRWYYDSNADAEFIARQAGVPLVKEEKRGGDLNADADPTVHQCGGLC